MSALHSHEVIQLLLAERSAVDCPRVTELNDAKRAALSPATFDELKLSLEDNRPLVYRDSLQRLAW